MRSSTRSFLFSVITVLAHFFLFDSSAFGFLIEPAIRQSGQVLLLTCDPDIETECLLICNSATSCEIRESTCKSCSGTQNLKLKRILDEVGTTLVADDSAAPSNRLFEILASHDFITLHARTLYNFSSQYQGAQINAQFRFLCPGTDDSTGILLLKTDSESRQIIGILGAICTNPSNHFSEFRDIHRNE